MKLHFIASAYEPDRGTFRWPQRVGDPIRLNKLKEAGVFIFGFGSYHRLRVMKTDARALERSS